MKNVLLSAKAGDTLAGVAGVLASGLLAAGLLMLPAQAKEHGTWSYHGETGPEK